MSKSKRRKPSRAWLFNKYFFSSLSKKKMAEMWGCSKRRMKRWLEDEGFRLRTLREANKLAGWSKRGPTLLDDPKELRRLYIDQELPTKVIGEMTGASGATVRNHLKKHGIPIRTYIEAGLTPHALEGKSEAMTGPQNPQWKGGITGDARAPGFTRRLKAKIRARDGNRCVRCGARGRILRALSVHHIDFDKNNHAESNLITLCESCHRWVHFHNIRIEIPSQVGGRVYVKIES